jgi:hypothetical protein
LGGRARMGLGGAARLRCVLELGGSGVELSRDGSLSARGNRRRARPGGVVAEVRWGGG